MLGAIGLGGIPRRRIKSKGFPGCAKCWCGGILPTRETATPPLAEFGGVDTPYFAGHAVAGWL
jgi:hypothetical protein